MFKHILIVFFVSMVPLLELRGAIPYGVVYGLPLWLTFVVAIVGNMLPVPVIYFLARRVLVWGQEKPVRGARKAPPQSLLVCVTQNRHHVRPGLLSPYPRQDTESHWCGAHPLP